MKVASVSVAKNQLSALLAEVQRGETVVITDHRRPIARLDRVEVGSGIEMAGLIQDGVLTPPRTAVNVPNFLALQRAVAPDAQLGIALAEDRDGR